MEIITTAKPKARKNHLCNFCGLIINKGEIYNYAVNKYEGEIYSWKTHEDCMKIATKLNMWDSCYDEGLTEEAFQETIHYEYIDLYPKDTEQHQFEYKLIMVLAHHLI